MLKALVAIAQDIVLKPFERTIIRAKFERAKLLADNLEPFIFSFQAPNRILKHAIFVEDNVTTVGETGFLYVSLGKLTSNM